MRGSTLPCASATSGDAARDEIIGYRVYRSDADRIAELEAENARLRDENQKLSERLQNAHEQAMERYLEAVDK
jgi:cell division protein FtsB